MSIEDEVSVWLASRQTQKLREHLHRQYEGVISQLVNAENLSVGATARLTGRAKSLKDILAGLEGHETFMKGIMNA